ncbi:peptidoglycan L-alanyl-D-glutamate endopeptidase CwlK [Nitrosomonas marina]|uniref:Peptidoglycan L-alanyl-D-glutamate endopeptidase CwlK n=1 Tax=Nitrosomonas marina TaxID=917 RepID=A0A1I0FWV8_9PROT|nr:M15 family metallopeptidase [Nitrosomonas marina]SET62833.1 peptidoglycan L-alanyl-D-glutamate endopeptidase CwlK [Nitrosomonas marina]
MSINQSIFIEKSVGKNGINQPFDVEIIKKQLNAQMPVSYSRLMINGTCDSNTIDTIIDFQKKVLGFRQPDGRVDPNGKTLLALNDPVSSVKWNKNSNQVINGQWTGDSSRWSQTKKLQSLNPVFRVKVQNVLDALTQRGFQPKIFFGWRSVSVQQELFNKGRSKVRFSFHNAQNTDGTPNAYAADIIDKRWGWEKKAEDNGFWSALGEEAKKQGLVWGGDWTSFKDVAHIQGRQNSELAKTKQESGL